MRKRLFTILIAIATCVVVMGQEEMVFTPQWTAQAQFAGYYVALEKGFYKREGLKVHIEHPYASNSCINMLKRGECQLITQPLISAIRQIDKGLHLVNLQQTSQNDSEMIISNRPIKSIKSLNGLRIGHWKAGYSELAFIMALQHGLRIEWIPFVQNENLFISSAIDATMAMSYNEYFQLRMSGIKIPNDHMFCFADYGYNIPEDGLYVTADYYATHKTAVDKFVKATREGWEWAAVHPEETLEIVMKMTKIDDVKTNKLVQRWMLNDFLKNMTNKKTGKRSYRLTPEALELANKLLLMIGSLPDEALVLRKASEHVTKLQERMIVQLPPVSTAKERRMDREKTVINLYAAGHPIDDIWKASGFHSRSSVFRILNKYNIKLNRGKHSGPIKKKGERKNSQDNKVEDNQ